MCARAGDWMGEARLGVTDMIDKIARLPGLQKTFDKVASIKEDHVLNARRELHAMAHSHGPDGIKICVRTPLGCCGWLLALRRSCPARLLPVWRAVHVRSHARTQTQSAMNAPVSAPAQAIAKVQTPAATVGARTAIVCTARRARQAEHRSRIDPGKRPRELCMWLSCTSN